MTNINDKYHVKRIVQSFAARSLYPSAMKRVAGYLRGHPQLLDTNTYDSIKQTDGYCVRVRVLKIHQHTPVRSSRIMETEYSAIVMEDKVL